MKARMRLEQYLVRGAAVSIAVERVLAAHFTKLRALSLQYLMPGIGGNQFTEFNRRTVAVGWLRNPLTNQRITVVSTSQDRWFPNVVNALDSNEIMLTGKPFVAHAEVQIMEWAHQAGYQVLAIGAGRSPCAGCQAMADAIGALIK